MRNSTPGSQLNRYSPHVSTFALIFVVLWLLGSISSLTMGGLLHIFLVVAIIMMLPRIIRAARSASISPPLDPTGGVK